MKKLRPKGNRVVVRIEEATDGITPGGIHLPKGFEADDPKVPKEGVVVAVGEGYRDDHGLIHETGYAPEETVIFGRYSGIEVKLGKETFVVLNAPEVIGVLEEVQV